MSYKLRVTSYNKYAFALSPFRPFALSCLLLFSFLPCVAQTPEPVSYIDAVGYAQMEVIPNQINVQITLKEYYDGVYKITVAEQESKMKNMLKIVGVDIDKVSFEGENSDYVTIAKKPKEAVAEKHYYLTLSGVAMYTNTFQVLNDLNIRDAKVMSVSHSQMDVLRQTVKNQALQNAKAKADALVSAIGNKLGKPLIIRENEYDLFPDNLNEEITEDEYGVAFKKIILQSSIYARFAIE